MSSVCGEASSSAVIKGIFQVGTTAAMFRALPVTHTIFFLYFFSLLHPCVSLMFSRCICAMKSSPAGKVITIYNVGSVYSHV